MSDVSVIHKSELRSVFSLKPNPRNAVNHPQSQINALAVSFQKFGFIGSILLDKHDTIIAGHGRVLAAIQAGMTEVPVILCGHLDEDEVRALMALDNELGNQRETDMELLAMELAELSSSFDFMDFNIDVTEMLAGLTGDTEGQEIPGRSTDPREGFDRDEDDDGYEEEDSVKPERETQEIDREDFDVYIPTPDEDESVLIESNDAPIPFSVEARVTAGSAWRLGSHILVCGDSSDASMVHKFLKPDSAHAIVTDPPYGISFMGKNWDHKVPSRELWEVWFSRLAPGAHLLSFCATRMYHHMATAIEAAGFEPRDMIAWMYGSGFPKSLDISKAIDKAAGAEREVVAEGMAYGKGSSGNKTRVEQGYRPTEINPNGGVNLITTPSTPSAKRWNGWGSGLKPSQEPIMLARKPCSEDTVAKNVQRFGTGALNIDGSRVKTTEVIAERKNKDIRGGALLAGKGRLEGSVYSQSPEGRWPANTILSHAEGCVEVGKKTVKLNGSGMCSGNTTKDKSMFGIGSHEMTQGNGNGTETVEAWECVDGCPVKELDSQSGLLKSGDLKPYKQKNTDSYSGSMPENRDVERKGDSGGASRFFYVAKPSKSDKNEGNNHATVKPLRLMEYLIRMITPQGGTVLEPFAGSGTTLLACERLKMKCVAFELDPHHCDIVLHRWQTMTGLQAEPYTN